MFYSHTGWTLVRSDLDLDLVRSGLELVRSDLELARSGLDLVRSGLVQLSPVHLAVLPHQQAPALVGSVFDARLSLEVRHGPTTSSSLVQVDSTSVTDTSSTSVVPAVTCRVAPLMPTAVALQVVVALPVAHLPVQVRVVSQERRSPARIAGCSGVPAVLLHRVGGA